MNIFLYKVSKITYTNKGWVLIVGKIRQTHNHDIVTENVGGNDGGVYLHIDMVIRPSYDSIKIRKIT